MFNVGDRVVIRDDFHLNKSDIPSMIGWEGIVEGVDSVRTPAAHEDGYDTILTVCFEPKGNIMELYPQRFTLVLPVEPDWEV
jgi:hypothetical protein